MTKRPVTSEGTAEKMDWRISQLTNLISILSVRERTQFIVWTEGMSTLMRSHGPDDRLVAHGPSTHIFSEDFHVFEEQERPTALDQH